jgi:hypothetical protein
MFTFQRRSELVRFETADEIVSLSVISTQHELRVLAGHFPPLRSRAVHLPVYECFDRSILTRRSGLDLAL